MKVYLACFEGGMEPGDVIGYALAEDGTALASHLSSGKFWSKHDMGLTGDWKHDTYAKHYPDGYELEWVGDPETHKGWLAAFKLNKAKSEEETKADAAKGSHFKASITVSEEKEKENVKT